MTHHMTILVLQLAVIVITARIVGHLFTRYLKQPSVLGELAAGMIIGPYALGSISIPVIQGPLFPLPETTLPVSPELYGFAVMASIILLFLAGLETDLPTFIRFSVRGSVVGLGGVVLSFAAGDLTAVLLLPGVGSFMDPTALFLGTLSTATSVGITARVLSEKRKLSSPEGVTVLAAAVLDDVLGIVLLAIVVGIAKVQQTGGDIQWGRIGFIAAKAFGFWLISTVLGIILAPRLTKGLKRLDSMDTIAGIAFGLAIFLAGLSELAGLAMIIGAYVMGLALSQTDIAHELREKLQGLYNFFVPIFFCVMGMMVDFAAIKAVFFFGLVYTAAAVAGKLLGCGVPALFAGFNLRGAFRIGAGMLPRGEVTLIVAGIGLASGAIGNDMFGVAIMTLLIASVIAPPVLIRSFSGGSGYRGREKEETAELTSLELDFGRQRLADFVRGLIISAFREEGFFSQRIDIQSAMYTLRKDNISITLVQKGAVIFLNTTPKHEQFVRLLVLEELLEMKDLLEGLKSMESPDLMGANLIMGLFAEEGASESAPEESKKDPAES